MYRTQIKSASVEDPTKTETLVDIEGSVGRYDMVASGPQCIVDVVRQVDRHAYHHQFWLYNTKTHEKERLPFPDAVGVPKNPQSPDGRYYVVCVGSESSYKLLIYDLSTRQLRTANLGEGYYSAAWSGSGEGLRWIGRHREGRWSVNPLDGVATRLPDEIKSDEEKAKEREDERTLSPDAAHRIARGAQGQIVVVDEKSGEKRELALSDAERWLGADLQMEWLSPRFIAISVRYRAWAMLDIQSMKLSYPYSNDIEVTAYSPDFKWVLGMDRDKATWLAPVMNVVP